VSEAGAPGARAGVDVGGTFTDVVVLGEDRRPSSAKVTSNPHRLDAGVVSGLRKASDQPVGFIGHGTTRATNVTLERSGPRVALIATEGFRDVLEIARLSRPAERLYALKDVVPKPLVARRDCFGIPERIGADGEIIQPLAVDAVEAAARTADARGIRDFAVCFLHAYRNPAHERQAADALRGVLPDARVSVSSDVWPEPREYERANTTVLNAYLRSSVEDYLARLDGTIRAAYPDAALWIMQSNGGLTSPERAAANPVRLVLSGPTGGVIGAQWVAERAGYRDLIAADMGGTSFDVSVMHDGRPPYAHQLDVMGLPVRGRALDVHAVGAGGGSIAWVDDGGQFRVGPRSAGAMPGPACYGRGGEEPTVTDADLVLGYLSPRAPLAAGELTLDAAAAEAACDRVGRSLGLDALATAWGIRRIVNTTMAGAVAATTLRRGIDPRGFTLLAYGGAGPMHAVDVAEEIGLERVLIPSLPGVFSALGMCVSDVVDDLVEALGVRVTGNANGFARERAAALRMRAMEELAELGVASEQSHFEHSVDMCYSGQNFTMTVPAAPEDDLVTVRGRFDALHEKTYGYSNPQEPVDAVSLRVRAVGRIAAAGEGRVEQPRARSARSVGTDRAAFGRDRPEVLDAASYDRKLLEPGDWLEGPAVVRSEDTTLVVPPGWTGAVDGHDNILLERS
jgi:N-methylhydantoinase A